MNKVVEQQKLTIEDNDWLQQRIYRVSGSKFYRVASWNRRTTTVFKKFKIIEAVGYSNTNGVWIERLVLESLKIIIGDDIIKHGYYKPSVFYKWLGATADGILFEDNMVKATIEIKTGKAAWDECDFISKSTFEIRQNSAVYYQLQLTMFVFECHYCIFFYLSKKENIKIKIVPLDADYVLGKITIARSFYSDYLIPYHCTKRFPLINAGIRDQSKISHSKTLKYMTNKESDRFDSELQKALAGHGYLNGNELCRSLYDRSGNLENLVIKKFAESHFQQKLYAEQLLKQYCSDFTRERLKICMNQIMEQEKQACQITNIRYDWNNLTVLE